MRLIRSYGARGLLWSAVACFSIAGGWAPAYASSANEPALQLRNAFIMQYATAAAAHGGSVDTAAKQAGCMFDIIAKSLTVTQYIQLVKNVDSGKPPGEPMMRLMPKIKEACPNP